MSTNRIVQAALTNEWLAKQGVPDLPALWSAYHYPPPSKAEPKAPVTSEAGETLRNRRMRPRTSGGVGAGGQLPPAIRLGV